MAIIKNYLKENFSIVPNEIIKTREIKGNVKDLLYLFYMLPESWEPNQKYFAEYLCVTQRTIERYIAELKQKGFLNTVKNNKGLNTFDYKLTIPTEMSEYIPTNDDTHIPTSHIPTNDIPTEMSEHINTNTLLTLSNSNTNISNTKEKEKIPYQEIIDFFNETTFKRLGVTPTYSKLIKARWNENKSLGMNYEENLNAFKRVIYVKFMNWFSDEKMKMYIRPETLFSTKFQTYLNEELKEFTTTDIRKADKIMGKTKNGKVDEEQWVI